MYGITGHELARQDFIGQGIFEQTLDGSFQWPRAIHRIEADIGQHSFIFLFL